MLFHLDSLLCSVHRHALPSYASFPQYIHVDGTEIHPQNVPFFWGLLTSCLASCETWVFELDLKDLRLDLGDLRLDLRVFRLDLKGLGLDQET